MLAARRLMPALGLRSAPSSRAGRGANTREEVAWPTLAATWESTSGGAGSLKGPSGARATSVGPRTRDLSAGGALSSLLRICSLSSAA